MGLLPIFLGHMAEMGWPGQFNFVFMCFLILSALWVSWRHQFSIGGLVLGLIDFFGGALCLSAYLFVESFRVDNRPDNLLLGNRRASVNRKAA